MDAVESGYTSWGERPVHHDVRALRRYNAVLKKAVLLLEATVGVLAVAVVAVFLWVLWEGNFENVIFTDGTSLACILDGQSGEIVNVDK